MAKKIDSAAPAPQGMPQPMAGGVYEWRDGVMTLVEGDTATAAPPAQAFEMADLVNVGAKEGGAA